MQTLRWACTSIALALLVGCSGRPSAGSSSGNGGSGGGSTGSGGAGACAQAACDAPPATTCLDDHTLRAYAAPGTCEAGSCQYAHEDSVCPNGCAAAACVQADPCAGVTCDHPPASSCADASTLTSYSPAGTCSNGACTYASTSTSCVGGCAAGACLGDPCLGVVCSTPPPPSCVAASTLRSYAPPGVCDAGSCVYSPTDTACPNGCAGAACKSTTVLGQYPGVSPSRIDAGAALGLRVAPDQAHVLVQRTMDTKSFDRGALAVISVDSTGMGSAVELTSAVSLSNGRPLADFSADGAGLFYVDVSSSPMKLVVAHADGTNARVLVSGIVQRTYPAGNVLVYMFDGPFPDGNRAVRAVSLPDGAPVDLVTPGMVYYPYVTPNSTGSAVVVSDQSGNAYQIIQTSTGASVALGSSAQVSSFAWSPDGARLAYWNGSGALRVVNADGSGNTVLAASGATFPRFSPDGQRLVYGHVGATGWLSTATVHSFSGAADVTLTPGAGHSWSSLLAFSGDGGLVVFTSGDGALGASPVGGGAMMVLSTNAQGSLGVRPYDFTPSHDRVAVADLGRVVTVVPTAGGAAQALSVPVDDPGFYEPVATNPGLLVFTSPTVTQSGIFGSVALYPTSGAGAPTTLPGSVLPAFVLSQVDHSSPFGWQGADGGSGQIAEPFTWGWLGSEIVYEARTSGMPGIDVVAATDNVATIGVIAAGAEVWAVRDGGTPSRVFFTHVVHDGVWSVALPQTP